MSFIPIAEEELCLITPLDTPSSNVKTILKNTPFIRFNKESIIGKTIDAFLKENDISVSCVVETNSLKNLYHMVYLNLGVTIAPYYSSSLHVLPLRQIPLGRKSPKRTLGLLFLQDKKKQILYKRFTQHFR